MVNVRVGGLIVKQARRLPTPNVRVGGLLIKQARRLPPPTVRVGGLLLKQARALEHRIDGGVAYETDTAFPSHVSLITVGATATEADIAVRGRKQLVTYTPTVLALGPQAYYQLNEAAGTTAHDTSGHGHDATLNSAPAWNQTSMSADGAGKAALFNGTQVAQTADDVPTHDYVSLVVPIYPTASFTTLIDRGGHYRLQVRSASVRFQVITDEAGGTVRQLDIGVAVEEVLQLAAVYDGTHLIVYINGVEQGRLGVAASRLLWDGTGTDHTIAIGGNAGTGGSFAGTMQDAAIFDKALTPTQIANLAHTFDTWVIEGEVTGFNTNETDTAMGGTSRLLVHGGQAVEFNLGIGTRTVLGTQAVDTQTALAGIYGAGARVTGGVTAEGDVALPGKGTVGAAGGTATETDAASTGVTSTATIIHGGVAVEGETALSGFESLLMRGTPAVETDLALYGVPNVIYPGTAALAESDTVLAGTVHQGQRVLGATSVETDTARAGVTAFGYAGGFAIESELALLGKVTLAYRGHPAIEQDSVQHGLSFAATVRWRFHDTVTGEVWAMPINPDSMSPNGPTRNLTHSRWRYGVTTIEQPRVDRELTWSGVIRSQAHYDALLDWASREHAVVVSDHMGRNFRVYITDFDPTDRSPIPRAPKRWRYTMKTKLLEEL